MKTVKKKIELDIESTEMMGGCSSWLSDSVGSRFRHTFISNGIIPNLETIECFVEVEEPETIKEFLQEKQLSKTELIEWLNKNYK